jgi:phosphohistidine phosphatase
MKSLLLIRHAKSSWDSATLHDFERPLNERGLRDAPMMAGRLIQRKITIDGWVSSTSKRAITTAGLFAQAWGQKEKNIIGLEKLYHAAPDTWAQVIAELPEHWNTVAIVGHNPGITTFANELGIARIDNMPTCGILGLHINCTHWHKAMVAEKYFWLFDYPKNL